MALKRVFKAEAAKLTKDPALVSNRELVQKFLEHLTPDFRAMIITRLSTTKKSTTAMTTGANPVLRRTEDPYDIDEVINKAVEIVTMQQGGTLASLAN